MTIVINRILCERYLRHAPCLEVVFKACFYRTAPCTFELHLDTVKLLPGSSPSDQTAYQVAMSRIVTVRNVGRLLVISFYFYCPPPVRLPPCSRLLSTARFTHRTAVAAHPGPSLTVRPSPVTPTLGARLRSTSLQTARPLRVWTRYIRLR